MSTGAAVLDLAAVDAGASVRHTKTITEQDVLAFAKLSGDYNPLHVDEGFARKTIFLKPVAHGMLLGSVLSRMIGMQLPGAGALWTKQSFNWPSPVFAGDTIDLTLRVKHKSAGSKTLVLEVEAVNQNGKLVMSGEGTVMLVEQRKGEQERHVSDRVAFVSCGESPVGRAVAELLVNKGAAVAVNFREMPPAENMVASLREKGGRAMAVQADPGDAAGLGSVFDRVREEFGRPVDVLVNSPSIPFSPRPFLETSWQDFQASMDSEVRAAFNCCQSALPGMVDGKSGCIVNIGTILTRQLPPPQSVAFVAAKHALLGLTRCLAAEFASHGVRVNMVSAGAIDGDPNLSDRLRKVQALQTPLRRLALVDDIAKAAVFLCSEDAGFITGVDLPVCGGGAI